MTKKASTELDRMLASYVESYHRRKGTKDESRFDRQAVEILAIAIAIAKYEGRSVMKEREDFYRIVKREITNANRGEELSFE